MPSPVRSEYHSEPHSDVAGWLFNYRLATPGVRQGTEGSVRLDSENEPQPDSVLFIDASFGGQARIDEDDYMAGAPELIFEVSSSSASIDLGRKWRVYRRNKVREYVVWRVLDRTVDWFVWRAGEFDRLSPDEKGNFRSTVFPGLWLSPTALVAGNITELAAVLNQGLATPEHAEFVARLKAAERS